MAAKKRKTTPKKGAKQRAVTTTTKPSVKPGALLTRLAKLCEHLPDVEQRPEHDHASFRVRDKVFAYFLNNHHGDGIVGVTMKAAPGQNTQLINGDPKRFYMPAYVGPRGWVAVRLDVDGVDWDQLRELMTASYRATAPKKLVDQLPVAWRL